MFGVALLFIVRGGQEQRSFIGGGAKVANDDWSKVVKGQRVIMTT